ncbi:hypothetical protein P154DRAFT_354326 [Amniculicola lignicola CBS 123094]|uniref:Uncharacterized protein n=1 Tax=Amniculicola lignicola CBS 123094 TaxID=1392246 RepID=A0A6A5X2B8_9PLEO|nr:hypothetical protein P154DRAFT_354326 [Amniculicola lignicola CBS 123094]
MDDCNPIVEGCPTSTPLPVVGDDDCTAIPAANGGFRTVCQGPSTTSLEVIGSECSIIPEGNGGSRTECDGRIVTGPAEPTDTRTVFASGPAIFTTPTGSAKPTVAISHSVATIALTTSNPDGALQTAVPSSASASASKSSDGVSKGAAAGIAIATAIIGAAIALVIAFFLFKRRNRRDRRTPYESIPESVPFPKDNHSSFVQDIPQIPPPVTAAAIAPLHRKSVGNTSHPVGTLAGIIPPPADEQAIRERFTHLFNQIQAHTDNYYRDVHANTTSSMEDSLAKFGSDSFPMVEALQNSSRPTNAIKRALSQFVMNLTTPHIDDGSNLFPTEVIGITTKSDFVGESDSIPACLLYRRLAVHLYSTQHSSSDTSPSSVVQSQIREAAEQFSVSFFAWANPTGDDQEKDEDLEQIIGEALDLQIWLYGEGFLYRWSWSREQLVGGMVVAPGLLKVIGVENEEKPRVVLEPRVLFD